MKLTVHSIVRAIRSQSGFTLTELIVASTIFAIAGLGLAQYQVLLAQRRVMNQQYTKAINYAEEKMEELRRIGYEDISPSDEPFDTGVHGDTNFSRTVAIVVPDLKRKIVTVTVQWKDPGGNIHDPPVEIKSIFSK